jgi:hypothetical protein
LSFAAQSGLFQGAIMAISQIFKRTFQSGGETLQKTQTVTANDLIAQTVSGDIAASGTLTVNMSIDVSKLVGVWISTDIDNTVFDFDGSTANLTIKADVPYVWSQNCNLTNALTDDFTQIVITNPSSTTVANIEIRTLQTP